MKRLAVTCITVTLAALTLLHAAAASSTTFVVNSTGDARDALVGDGRCATSTGMCTLRAAVAETNALRGADTIQVPAGTYEIAIPPLNQNDVTTGDLDVTDSLTISGAGAGSTIVDGGVPAAGAPVQVHGLDRLFEVLVDGGEVNFTGLTFSDGYAAEYGGAIVNSSTATVRVSASTLTRNVAGKAGGAIDNHLGGMVEVRDATLTGNFAYENGSALNNNRDGTLTVAHSTVSSNSAAAVGLDESLVGAGAISNNAELDTVGTVNVTDSEISHNRAGGGRAGATISNDGAGVVVVERTAFSQNRATGDGGAIFNGSGQVSVIDSVFTDNSARDGGAVYNNGVSEGRVTVRGSAFTQNSASGRGGAIVSGGTGMLTVRSSAFTKNSAEGLGGAIMSDDKAGAAIEGSRFLENAGLSGGAFANEGTGFVTVASSTFTKNVARVTAILAAGEGGGMHTNSVGDVVIIGSAFTDNSARSGGGLSNEGGGTLTITGTRFADNSADEQGGGILIQSGAIRMLDIDVIGNVADGLLEAGGGISYQGDKAVSIGESAAIEGSRIRDNKAKGDGGGIDSRGDGPLSITTTTIAGNTAAGGGGIHHVGDAPLDVTRSALSGNFAERGGGLFTDGDGETGVENTTVSGNRAGQFGGGLLVSSRLAISSSTVAQNSAPSGGGINNGGGDLVGDGSVHLRNTIVANNPTGGNCAGTMTSLGGNLENGHSCELRELSDQPGTDPLLGPLADNGGPTLTHELLEGSPAQERAVCTELEPCPPVDQRGVARPLFVGVDVGAFESGRPPSGGGPGQSCTGRMERPVPADVDSWVSQGAPSANFGSDATLKVESKPSANDRALVHFALPPVPPGCKLVGATLRLHSSSATDGHTLEALRVEGDWTELGVTWANQPGTAGPAATTQSGLGVREWDVLAQTHDMYALGNDGILVRDADENGSGEQSFHSTEKGIDNPPQLVLVFDDPDGPPRPEACPTSPQSIAADRDGWVSQGSPSNNFGSDSTLKVKSQLGYNSRALIRFPLPALPAGCTSIASATLRVEAASAKDGRTLEALRVASDWSEAGVTWSNQPATAGPAATVPSAEGPLDWTVTDQVLGTYSSANHGFLIRDAAENGVGDEQSLHSRDKLNDAPPELVLVFDDSTPETAIDSGPPSPTDSTEASFEFSSDRSDATFECSLDEATFRACSSPHAVRGLVEGDHRLEVRAVRQVRAIDPTPASYDWTVAVPPETTVAGPASPSASPNAVLAVSSDDPDASFECSLNGAPFAACTSPVEYRSLADGRHEVRVRAVDSLGSADPTPAAHAWTVAVPPEARINGRPADLSNSASTRFEFTGSDNTTAPAELAFECRLDSGAWERCASPHTTAALADGEHGFEVRAIDAAGNTGDVAGHMWTIDTVAPAVTIDSAPPLLSNVATARFEFGSEDGAKLECRLDGGDFAACESAAEYSHLAEGEHSFDVRATDAAGNVGEAARHVWTVDTVAPVVTIVSGPLALTNRAMAVFEFGTEAGATLECRLDGGEWAGCESPYVTAALADGEHGFEARATDAAANTGEAASSAWTVDTVAPAVTIVAGPQALTNRATAAFEFSSEEGASLECRLDAGDWTGCESPYTTAAHADGEHTFAVRASDGAANVGQAASRAWTIDTVTPAVTIDSAPPLLSNVVTARFEFGSESGAGLECRLDGGEWAACESPYLTAALTDGSHEFDARATDAAGNTGAATSYTWSIDTVAPAVTIASAPPALTNRATAVFEFSSEAGASLECRLDGGDWMPCESPVEHLDLPDDEHSFAVRATDAAGNTGEATGHTWTIDTVAPAVTIDSAPAPLSTRATARFELGSEPGARLECRLDGGDWAGCESPYVTAALADGEHGFEVRAIDAAGNTGDVASDTWTIDTVAPAVTIDSAPPLLSNVATARFEFGSEDGAKLECRLDGGDFAACESAAEYSHLAEGEHSFDVRATDAAGNVGEAARHVWTVDTVAPVVTIVSGPLALTNRAMAVFEFGTEAGATLECRLDGGEWAGCESPYVTAALADGEHGFEARATDAAANTGEAASSAWTVDTVAPAVTIVAGPQALTNRATAAFEFSSEEGASLECRLDAGDWTGCESPYTTAALADGEHTFEVRATDAAGNVGDAATYIWSVDTAAPAITIDSAPEALTNRTSARFTFTSELGASLECRLDAGEWAACASPYAIAGPLADGEHTFAVRATDAAGNTGDAASHAWTVDTVAPSVTIDEAPPALSNAATARFEFSSEAGAKLECRLDGGDWAGCESPHTTASLLDGEHTFAVRATDRAGNTGEAASYPWTIDTAAPAVTIDSAPAVLTNEATARFEFASEAGASLECRLDGGDWAACESPADYRGLPDGAHGFDVRATDAAGNTGDAASYGWTVDTAAPAVTIDSGPPARTNDRSAGFTFTSERDASAECRLDGGEWAACASPYAIAGPLADDEHTFAVRATDAAGNTGEPASYTWTMDTVAPAAAIRSGPPALSNSASARFEFGSEPGASLECQLDGAGWEPCGSPADYDRLADGEHTFEVRATDAAGNTGAAASYTWSVDTTVRDTTPPDTTLTDRPSDPSNSAAATFRFDGTDDATLPKAIAFECRVDAAAFAACSSPDTTAALADGAHTFQVRATDAAGNVDPTPASYTWTIDTAAPQTTINSGQSGLTSDSTPTYAFSSEAGASFECHVDGGAFAACSSPHTTAALADGVHTFEVRATDAAGNTDASPASRALTVDTAAPQTTITGAPPATTSSSSATFVFGASDPGSTFECSLDGAANSACTSPAVYSGLAAGSHQFSVRATDPAGNTDPTPATHTWTISFAPACGQPVTAAASADAWIDENSPTNNKGTDSILKVQSKGPRDNFRAVVRFPLPAIHTGCAVQSATLRLYASSSKPGRTLHALRLTSAWTENQVSWMSQLLTTGSLAATTSGLGYREWNVTTHVEAMYAGPNHGFLIRDAVEAQDAEQQFHSREKGANPPQLVVRFAPSAG